VNEFEVEDPLQDIHEVEEAKKRESLLLRLEVLESVLKVNDIIYIF
jgi:hypothetical protein